MRDNCIVGHVILIDVGDLVERIQVRHASGRAAERAISKPSDAVIQRSRSRLKIVLDELIPRDIQCIRICSGQIFVFLGVRNLHAGNFNIVFV